MDDSTRSEKVNAFLTEIDRIRSTGNVDYIDAVLSYCEKNQIEIDQIAKFVKKNPIIKAKIQEEAEALNVLEKTPRLPIDDDDTI